MREPRPNFLVIGAQRCGTTWLWHQLDRHPETFVTARKELEFFSYTAHLTTRRWRKYLQNFEPGRDLPWRGECTPSYFMTVDENSRWCRPLPGFNPTIPADVRRYLGDGARLVLALRDPVDRAVSAYFHHVRHGRVEPGQTILDVGRLNNLIDAGFYARHLAAWLEHFPLEQFCIVTTPQIESAPREALAKVAALLGLSAPFPDLSPAKNTGYRLVRVGESLRPLRRPLAGFQVSDADRRQLAEIYAPDLERLTALLGRDPFAA